MKFVLIILFTIGLAINECEVDNRDRIKLSGMSKQKEDELMELHNEHRNLVAYGKVRNWYGEFSSATNMYCIKWDDHLARNAQDCANKCPTNFQLDCSFPRQYGYLTYKGEAENAGSEWSATRIFQKLLQQEDFARQIELATAQFFGCGRTQITRRNGKSQEIFVCVYNKQPNLHGDVYKYGIPGQDCIYGRKAEFSGLCKQSANDIEALKFRHKRHQDAYKYHHKDERHHVHHNHHRKDDGFHTRAD
ncbi:unnamed protein product (macronuclear) [Paramecium tetraurelia]|uniref:SCP domain-containing protein n=1 Tax=Paramecium tetraurelia TaxID=5888 RepID=A0CVF7_PARTE|nr:uncharacterized protein GSPATT00010942001 [Paramecium tetraurelia]CAK74774.1 unnamed protein product [Paramecium tetraurelia]|eukprot:XP_001442171.1 hypothetical protein (macronuclear) [Paramecium tetraurelia strain d4-2]